MRFDIGSSEIRDKLLVTMWLDVERQAALGRVIAAAEALCGEKQPELERHIESRQIVDWISVRDRS